MTGILNTKTLEDRNIITQISRRKDRERKSGIFLDMEQRLNGTRKKSRNKIKVALFAALRIQMCAVISCTLIIGTDAALLVERAINVVAAFFVTAAIILSNALIPSQIGQSRLSPILGGTRD